MLYFKVGNFQVGSPWKIHEQKCTHIYIYIHTFIYIYMYSCILPIRQRGFDLNTPTGPPTWKLSMKMSSALALSATRAKIRRLFVRCPYQVWSSTEDPCVREESQATKVRTPATEQRWPLLAVSDLPWRRLPVVQPRRKGTPLRLLDC